MDAQLKKGFVEACVLTILRGGDSYGYQIIRDASEYMELSESTLYPVLRRLEKSGKVKSYTVEHEGRLRRYFSFTDAGEDYLRAFRSELSTLKKMIDFIESGDTHE